MENVHSYNMVFKYLFRDNQLEFVDSINTTALNEGWLTFNMKDPMRRWVAIPNTNLGVYISVANHSKYSIN